MITHDTSLLFITRAFFIEINFDISLSYIALSCSSIWTMLRWADCSPFCFCFWSILPESPCFLFRTFLAIFFNFYFSGQWLDFVFHVPSRLIPEPHSLLCVDSTNVVDCLEVQILSPNTGTCTHLFSNISSITDIFVEAHCSLDFIFFSIWRAKREHQINLFGIDRV